MKTIPFLLLITTISFGQAPTPEPSDDGQELIDKFFDYYKRTGHEFALKYAFSTNKWIEVEGDEMNMLITKLSKEVLGMGEFLGYEEIRSRKLGSRYRITSYFAYYLRDPVRFTFELYKTTGGWEISSIVFDSGWDEELEESMRFSNVPEFR